MTQPRRPDLDAILPRLSLAVSSADPRPTRGRVREIRGVIVHASLPQARIGELCHLRDPVTGRQVPAEVIGFEDERAVLSPIGDLEGMSARAEVIPTGRALRVPVGEALLGRVIDPLGRVLDAGSAALATAETYPIHADPPHALQRDIIEHPLRLGVRAIDGLMTIARGQRVGIFGEPGVGKSSLLASIVAGTEADVIVVGLIGERGREVREFVDVQLGAQARGKTVTVVATSDRPAIERVKAAYVATAIAEYFRDRGRNVLLLMDSVTRFARAQREIGLAAGEPPTRRGFPPSFFAALPRLLERAGPGKGGSITALYTVLTEGEGGLDPVAEETKAILDGHIVLSADLAQRNHFPAIDVLKSRSRLMNTVVPAEHRELAGTIRENMAAYQDIELLLRVGEYVAGSDVRADAAVSRHDAIEAFLRQSADEICDFQTTLERMREIVT
ncbi:EscN/YscN/HrcN family type III secretion system ATPase [Phyllobacterium phragmitis]|uniref:Type 3 secretion system ATPase n=1 Tax=Phyllobacterium phragmitis TaxID=2670329 RepID=A0A2S9IML5_9HYPH|nr:type III secretion system ATPase SctN [Phyllobacterium phragmitis]PRD41755.1 EscN/YscN/HrcN family type III secretion system ATPase [Phyllobacterium phragmitis]